jgi:hypothetical protein
VLLCSHVMVHREVHVFLQLLLEPLYLLLPLLQDLLLLASLLLELGLEGLDLLLQRHLLPHGHLGALLLHLELFGHPCHLC